MTSRAALQHSRSGFTLLEVIVVISIVVLLTALTVTVATGVLRKSEQRSTENVLKLLDLAMNEWQGEADRQISWGLNDDPFPGNTYDINPDMPQVSNPDDMTMLQIVLKELRGNTAANDILRKIEPKFTRTVTVNGESVFEVVDAWDNPFYVIHPGRVSDPRTFSIDSGNQIDEDGTIRVDAAVYTGLIPTGFGWERVLGVGKNRRICFVSAGLDSDFGNLRRPADSDDFKATADNLYSYPVGKP